MKISPHDDALVQGLVDGTLDAASRTAAEQLIATSAEARQRFTEVSELVSALNGIGLSDAPTGLTASVMDQVRESSVTHVDAARSRRESPSRSITFLMDGGLGMGKKLMWGVAAAAALTLVVMRFTGFPPLDAGTQGTIGAAKRYQAPQIAAADVKVDDSAQAFLQTDTFDQLMKDPDARQMLASPSFRGALASPEFRSALASPDFAKALATPEFAKALASPEFARALAAADFRSMLATPGFSHALANADFAKALATPGFAKALASADFAKALAAPGFAKALSNAGFAKALASPGFARALASPQMAQAVGLAQ